MVCERVGSWYSGDAKRSGGWAHPIQVWAGVSHPGDFAALTNHSFKRGHISLQNTHLLEHSL
jgi:hypothetical protein